MASDSTFSDSGGRDRHSSVPRVVPPGASGVFSPQEVHLPERVLLPDVTSRILHGHGVNASRPRKVLALLSDGRWWSLRDLVRTSGVAHAVTSGLVADLVDAGELVRERDNGQDRVRLARPEDYAAAGADDLADPVAHLAPGYRRIALELSRVVSGGPTSDLDLDHVTATADTALRRALFLATRFELADSTVLCVGDHDLTSVALALVSPGTRVTVVDIDERVLAHIDKTTEQLGVQVRTHAADLRLGLPSTLRGTADVVFTDPPYTPDGVELFVRRGLEGMSDPRKGRVLLSYGVSEASPRPAATTQARLLRMELLVEAMWPDFNRYHGAESIGAASDLYVLRPLSRARPSAMGDNARVYSQGTNAKEARGGLDHDRAEAVLRHVDEDLGESAAGSVPVLVGSWPREIAGSRTVRLSTWMDSPVTDVVHAVVNLTGGWERLVPRVALAAAVGTESVYLLVPSSSTWVRDQTGQEALRTCVEPRFRVRFLRGFGANDLSAIRLVPRTAPEPAPKAGPTAFALRLLTHVQERAHGTLTSTLRAGLVETSRLQGRPMNKRTSRHAVAATPRWILGHNLLDLPGHRFEELPRVAADLLEQVEE